MQLTSPMRERLWNGHSAQGRFAPVAVLSAQRRLSESGRSVLARDRPRWVGRCLSGFGQNPHRADMALGVPRSPTPPAAVGGARRQIGCHLRQGASCQPQCTLGRDLSESRSNNAPLELAPVPKFAEQIPHGVPRVRVKNLMLHE